MNKQILRLAIPNIITNITVPLLGMVDTAIVGHLQNGDGVDYIGAIAVGTMIFNIIYWNFGFLRMGTSGFTAQAYGAKDKEEKGRWNLGTTKTLGSSREIYICDTLYSVLSDYKKSQIKYKKEYGKKYKKYILKEIKNKYGKLVEYKVIESQSRNNKIHMVFTRKDGTYAGTDIIKYPFKIIHHELGIKKCRFYDLRGSYATKILRNGAEIRDVADILGHSRIETTENYYINCTKDNLKNVSNSFEKELGLNMVD